MGGAPESPYDRVVTLSLHTERLLIRMLSARDREAFVAYRQISDVARYQSWTTDYSAADADALLADQPTTSLPTPGGWMQLALIVPDTGDGEALVGDVAVGVDAAQPATYELGVTLAPAHQGQGYAQEALIAVIAWLMGEQGAHRIVMQGDARNDGVLRLMRRLELRHEGSVLEGDWFKGEWTTLERFALLRREWEARLRR